MNRSMNRSPNGHRQNTLEPFPGCMGKMINVFDLSAGMAENNLPPDKAHRDGSPVRRNKPDPVKKPIDPVRGHIDERPISANDARKSSSKKSNATPMKMLIAQEMLKDSEPKQQQPSIVARLMGLDNAMPVQQPVLTAKGNLQESYPRSKSAGASRGRRQQGDVKFEQSVSHEIHSCSHEKECKDVYEVYQQPSRTNLTREYAPPKERLGANQDRKRMDLVRQKFTEAKRLATDEKLLHSREFQDALEVLSSNRDLFLKFLEEPNALFSKHTQQQQSVSSLQQKTRITLLKPSKFVEPKVEKRTQKKRYSQSSGNEWETGEPCRVSNSSNSRSDDRVQPTRIVVLKPNLTKSCDIKVLATTPSSSPEMLQHTAFYRSCKTKETMGSREIAQKIPHRTPECVSSHRRDESLLSSVLSNGYVGDDSSLDIPENEYMEEDVGNFSDSEIMSPISRNSWDYISRNGRPYSPSSLSRTSCSPESSVIKEARKRLSERWASVASKDTSEEVQAVRSVGTLGEMLAIHEVKKKSISRSYGGEDELMAVASYSPVETTDVGGGESSPMTLSRSQSVPVSSSAYQNITLECPDGSQINTSTPPKEATKLKSAKSSFKGKVSSFFSRNKKPVKQKIVPSQLVGSEARIQSCSPEPVLKIRDDLSKSVCDSSHEEIVLRNPEEPSSKASSPASGSDCSRMTAFSSKILMSPRTLVNNGKNQGKLGISENSITIQDQPSPTSILDALFEDDAQSTLSCSSEVANGGHFQASSRSAPIEPIACSLLWDDAQLEISPSKPSTLWRDDEEEHTWFIYFQNLVSSAGLDNVRVDAVFTKWHSPESPLDPLLLYKILDQREEGAKIAEKRSSQHLLFDCVNTALLDVGHTALLDAYPWTSECGKVQKHAQSSALVAKEVWSLVKGWHSSHENQVTSENQDSSLVAEQLLRKDVSRAGWAAKLMRTEEDEVCQELEGWLLEKLLSEALLEFCTKCL